MNTVYQQQIGANMAFSAPFEIAAQRMIFVFLRKALSVGKHFDECKCLFLMFGREFFKPFFERGTSKNIVFHESKSRFSSSIEVNFSPLRSSSSWRAIFIRSFGTLSSKGMEWVRATCLQKRLIPSLRLIPYCLRTAVAISLASLSIRMLVLVRMANSFLCIVPQMGCYSKKYTKIKSIAGTIENIMIKIVKENI